MEVNKNYNESCIETLLSMPDNFLDLVVTSPPYDGLRKYESIISDDIFILLYNKIKQGGVLCWNVFDEKKEGSYSVSSLKQVLKFIEAGFNLHQYLVYEKNSVAFNAKKNGKLYTNIFEFVFVFSKGEPKTVNLICDKKNKHAGQSSYDGKVQKVADFSPRTTIWKYTTSQNDKTEHPAVMPEKLAEDLIYSYSDKSDIVYDPFMGSGTTAKMAIINNRNWIGSEISSKYCRIINRRVNGLTKKLF